MNKHLQQFNKVTDFFLILENKSFIYNTYTYTTEFVQNTVNSEIFARILVSHEFYLKDIFARLKFRDMGICKQKSDFTNSQGFIFLKSAKLRENKTIKKIRIYSNLLIK